MAAQLSERSACFEFLVQTQKDPNAMPIEDPTVEWSESESPFSKLGTLTISRQNFESPEQMKFCENLSFNPWHSLVEQRPLGGINRMRRVVYEAISKARHELNHELRAEPTGNEVFH